MTLAFKALGFFYLNHEVLADGQAYAHLHIGCLNMCVRFGYPSPLELPL